MAKKPRHNPDYSKDTSADLIKKGSGNAIPQEHWQVNRQLTPVGDNSSYGVFFPRPAKSRPTMHIKINECDH